MKLPNQATLTQAQIFDLCWRMFCLSRQVCSEPSCLKVFICAKSAYYPNQKLPHIK